MLKGKLTSLKDKLYGEEEMPAKKEEKRPAKKVEAEKPKTNKTNKSK